MYKDKEKQKAASREAVRRHRAKQKGITQQGITSEGITEVQPASLQDYNDDPDRYVQRLEPEKLNWGPWMNSSKLARHGFKANRVAIPGDWDYMGCVTQEREVSKATQ